MPDLRSAGVFFKQAVVSNVAKSLIDIGFTQAQVAAADVVIVSVDTGALRAVWDSTIPTTSSGMVIPNRNNPIFLLSGRNNASRLLLIRDGGSDCTCNISIESD